MSSDKMKLNICGMGGKVCDPSEYLECDGIMEGLSELLDEQTSGKAFDSFVRSLKGDEGVCFNPKTYTFWFFDGFKSTTVDTLTPLPEPVAAETEELPKLPLAPIENNAGKKADAGSVENVGAGAKTAASAAVEGAAKSAEGVAVNAGVDTEAAETAGPEMDFTKDAGTEEADSGLPPPIKREASAQDEEAEEKGMLEMIAELPGIRHFNEASLEGKIKIGVAAAAVIGTVIFTRLMVKRVTSKQPTIPPPLENPIIQERKQSMGALRARVMIHKSLENMSWYKSLKPDARVQVVSMLAAGEYDVGGEVGRNIVVNYVYSPRPKAVIESQEGKSTIYLDQEISARELKKFTKEYHALLEVCETLSLVPKDMDADSFVRRLLIHKHVMSDTEWKSVTKHFTKGKGILKIMPLDWIKHKGQLADMMYDPIPDMARTMEMARPEALPPPMSPPAARKTMEVLAGDIVGAEAIEHVEEVLDMEELGIEEIREEDAEKDKAEAGKKKKAAEPTTPQPATFDQMPTAQPEAVGSGVDHATQVEVTWERVRGSIFYQQLDPGTQAAFEFDKVSISEAIIHAQADPMFRAEHMKSGYLTEAGIKHVISKQFGYKPGTVTTQAGSVPKPKSDSLQGKPKGQGGAKGKGKDPVEAGKKK